MKKLYLFFFSFIFIILSGCSKDFLKPYEDRLEGSTWRLVDIDKRGIGGGSMPITFRDGEFSFFDNGELRYTDGAGNVYNGSWNMRKYWMRDRCYIDENGYEDCDEKRVRSLSITAVDFSSQRVLNEFFDDIVFTGTNRFKAFIYTGFATYIFRFRR